MLANPVVQPKVRNRPILVVGRFDARSKCRLLSVPVPCPSVALVAASRCNHRKLKWVFVSVRVEGKKRPAFVVSDFCFHSLLPHSDPLALSSMLIKSHDQSVRTVRGFA